MDKFYITTPLYYVNSKPHIGHSYTQVACDAVSRFLRQRGYDVFFMTGTDEHGEKIEKACLERGLISGDEQKFVDNIVPVFKDLWKRLDIRYDRFIRTTDACHTECVRAVLDKLYADGKIYKKIYNGWFCTPCETFWSQTQSSDGVCPDCKRQLQKLDESNYFFKTSEYQSWLISHIKDNPDFIKPDFRKNEVLGFLNEPLQDLCISRPKNRMAWGIEMPFDREFVTYVWFDALLNYISGIGYPRDAELFKKLWPCDVHVIGKDILRHHAVYWPIILKAIGIEPPRSIFAHGWWVLKGEKMSKSKGNVIDPVDVISKYGLDAYRYFLLREVPFGLDGTFSEKALINRYNSDLANDIGNLLSRTLAMLEKYFGGAVPDIETGKPMINPESGALKAKTLSIAGSLEQAIPALDFSGGLSKIWEAINSANKFIEDSKPWALAKEKKTDLLKEVVYTLVEVLRISAIAVYPVMPSSAKKIWESLGQTSDLENVRFQEMKVWGRILRGTKVKKSNPLFPRIEKS